MYDVDVRCVTTIVRPDELFAANGLSKIYVDEQFRMFFSVENNKEILVFKNDDFKNFLFDVAHRLCDVIVAGQNTFGSDWNKGITNSAS
ncbi:hypothetical protein MAR_026818 [Mya arenaria]|uniref:Uncharacterized protein n=1 Tax=Mya arenaria TaxID=6604 RepID=A0ABY7EVT8_MYAAR|nr:hypothetical protein MAR_026818 [Mya arenaria]